MRKVACLLAILLVLFSDSFVFAASSLQSLALHLSDLRPGYSMESVGTGYRTLQGASENLGWPAWQLRTHGWSGMYAVFYSRPCAACSGGSITVFNELQAYRTPAGAHWHYAKELKQATGQYKFHWENGTPVGNEHAAYFNIDQPGPLHTAYFRRGRYVVLVAVGAQAPAGSADALAHVLDTRIQRYG